MTRLAPLLFVACVTWGAVPIVDKVEPPNWWPNHTLNPVRVLIHGKALAEAEVEASSPCMNISNVHANAAGTYLFADVFIGADCKVAEYPLKIVTAGGTVKAPFRLDQPLDDAGRFQGFSGDDVIYLIMPDRFANGSNRPGSQLPRGYHGGDFQGIINRLPYLKSLGVTTLWLTPIYDNADDYHGYGAIDYYGVEELFGDMRSLKDLVDRAHAMGLKVIQDQVANHVGPKHPWVSDEPTPAWFHGTAKSHINETWQIWNLPDAHSTEALKQNVLNGWFADVLPDLNQDDPDVARYEIQNALWWVGTIGFDGIRQDTLPYVPRTFWHNWSGALHRQYPKLRMVGEVFDQDVAIPSYFQGGAVRDGVDTGFDSVFDFPTYFAMRDVFAHGKDMDTLAKVLAKDRLYPNPSALVPFEGNHDVMRFMSEQGATAGGLKLAFAYLLTTRGTPEIYYGDEIGMTGGDDPENRHDFPSGDVTNNEIFRYVQKLLQIRASLAPLRRGALTSLALDAKTWIYEREYNGEKVLVALSNSNAAVDIPSPNNDGYSALLGAGTWSGNTIHLPAHAAEIFSRTSRK